MSFPTLCAACRIADWHQQGIPHEGCVTAVEVDLDDVRDCQCWCFDPEGVLPL